MISRRQVVIALGVGPLISPFVVFAQQQAKVRRIGFLASSMPPAEILEAFRDGLRERGYVEGKSVVVEYRWPSDTNQSLPDLAVELVRLKVDLIFAWATPATLAAKRATSTIPIVIVGVADPVGSGIVASLARPGGNVTGVSNLSRDLSGKAVELLVQIVPQISRFAALRNVTNPSSTLQLKETEAAARQLGLQMQLIDIRTAADFESAFVTMSKARSTGVVIIPDPIFLSRREQIAELALKHRLPTIFGRRENAEAGGLMAYGPRFSDEIRQAVAYVDRIFKGAKPADLPVEQPTKFELIVNGKTAKALGLKIPQSMLLRADKVIE